MDSYDSPRDDSFVSAFVIHHVQIGDRTAFCHFPQPRFLNPSPPSRVQKVLLLQRVIVCDLYFFTHALVIPFGLY